jgi:hypothetical protein
MNKEVAMRTRLFTTFLLALLFPICTHAAAPVGTASAEIRGADKRIDIDRTIDALTKLGVNTYYYLIWEGEHDWEDFPAFLDAAAKHNIEVWAYVVPWSETPPHKTGGFGYSEPFRNDYVAWASEIAKLSLAHSNLVGYVIDDFYDNTEEDHFTPKYVRTMIAEGKKINPKLKFYPMMYFQTPWTEFINRFGSMVDGVVICYPKSEAGVRNAAAYLQDRRHGPSAIIELPRHHGAERGDGASVWFDVGFTDPANASFSFYYDVTDDIETNEGMQHARIRIDGRTVWESPTEGRRRDGIINIDLRRYLRNAKKVRIQFDVITLRTGVPDLLPVVVRFDDIRVNGVGETADRYPTNLNLKGKPMGKYEVTIMPGSNGTRRFDLPIVLMPSGEKEQYEKRYDTKGTPQLVAEKVKMSLDLVSEEICEGVVTYRTPLNPNGQMFDAIRKEFAAFARPKVAKE